MKKVIFLISIFTMICITSCSKEEKMYTCKCTITLNNPGQFTNPAPITQTLYRGKDKAKADECFRNNNGNNGVSTGVCNITVE